MRKAWNRYDLPESIAEEYLSGLTVQELADIHNNDISNLEVLCVRCHSGTFNRCPKTGRFIEVKND